MKKLFSVFFFSCFLVLLLFLLFGGYEEEMTVLLQSQSEHYYWILSFVFLSSDIFLPVPSSLIMMMNGKVLGVFFGTLLSTSSGMLSSVIGFCLGRKSESFVDRFFSTEEKKSGTRFFERHGSMAISLSKALPIVSEAVSFVSGTADISFRRFFLFSLIGHFIISLIYAYIGSFSTHLDSGLLSSGLIVLVLLLSWAADILLRRKAVKEE